MLIDISKILMKKGETLSFEGEEPITSIEDCPDVQKVLEPVKVKGTVTNVKGSFEVCAKCEAAVLMACSRCLEPVKVKAQFDLDELFSNTGNEEEAETFEAESLDLTSAIKRNLLLNLPMKVICKEDCKGLCPICGSNLNQGQCGCKTDNIDPRFERLRSLFKLDEEV